MAVKQLKIATMNLYNLQIAGSKMYRGNLMKKKVYDGKIIWTADKLKTLDADVIGFQELWHPDALSDAFKKAGLINNYELVTRLYPGSVAVALAFKKKHKRISNRWIEDLPDELVLRKKTKSFSNEPNYKVSVGIKNFSRAILKVNIKPEKGPAIIFYTAHLKSKLAIQLDKVDSSNSNIKPHQAALGSALATIRRTAEAAGLRILVNKTLKVTDTPAVVLGDLNDSQLSVTTAIITGQPKYRLYEKSRVGQRSDKGLYSVATLQELRSLRDVYYTHIFNGIRESLDHILVSEQFYDHSNKRIWSFRELRIINDHLDNKEGYGSDHGAVCATFDYNPMT